MLADLGATALPNHRRSDQGCRMSSYLKVEFTRERLVINMSWLTALKTVIVFGLANCRRVPADSRPRYRCTHLPGDFRDGGGACGSRS